MTFPYTFPFTFPGGTSAGSPTPTLPIQGWWPEIYAHFTLVVPPTIGAVGVQPIGFGLSVPPSVSFTGAGRSGAAFGLSTPPSLSFAATGRSVAAFTLAVPPSLAAAGAAVLPGGFGLSVPPAVTMTGVAVPNDAPTNIQVAVTRAATR